MYTASFPGAVKTLARAVVFDEKHAVGGEQHHCAACC